MHRKFHLSPVAAALTFSFASSVFAAQAVNLQDASFLQLKQQFKISSSGILTVDGQKDSLKFLKQHTDKNQVTHVRMQQYYAGLPVFGGYAITHSAHNAKGLVNASNEVKMNGRIYQGIHLELGKPSQAFLNGGQEALNNFKKKFSDKTLSEENVTAMVYIDNENQAHWAYKVSVFAEDGKNIPARPSAILDAKTLKPFVQWNDVKTERSPAKAIGYGGNHKVGDVSYDSKEFPYLEISRDDEAELCFMENDDVKVVDMDHRYSSMNKPMSFNCADDNRYDVNVFWTGYDGDGYDRYNGATSPSNDALYAGYVIKHLYHDWYGVDALKNADGSPMKLVMRVHYGSDYENAYWDGRQMTFGDGGYMLYPLVSLGVGSHEISHGFTEQHSDLNYFSQSGGMNESFSDMAAQAAEYYSTGKASYQIGPEIMKESSGWDALRFMDIPSKDGMSIDSADEYYGGLDVHYSSGVYNRLYYLIASSEGWNPRKAFDVMVKANMDYWTPYTDFEDGACGVISATKDLNYSVADVKKALKKVAISVKSCKA
jgi:pseudolysin